MVCPTSTASGYRWSECSGSLQPPRGRSLERCLHVGLQFQCQQLVEANNVSSERMSQKDTERGARGAEQVDEAAWCLVVAPSAALFGWGRWWKGLRETWPVINSVSLPRWPAGYWVSNKTWGWVSIRSCGAPEGTSSAKVLGIQLQTCGLNICLRSSNLISSMAFKGRFKQQ